MKVTVIIPTFNAENYLPVLLNNLSMQTLNFELIIIDSSSTDKTIHIAKKYTDKIIIIPKHSFDHGGTRTQAIKASSGDFIIFLTQDALPTQVDTLEKIISIFTNKRVGAAYGRQIAYDSTNIFGKHLRSFNYPDISYIRKIEDKDRYGMKTIFLSDSFSAYRKSAIQEVNYFKKGLIFGEDAHISAKLLSKEWHIAYTANTSVYHSHSYTLCQEFKRYFDMGVFHTMEQWILDTFGNVEGEGMRYIKSEFFYLLQHKAYLRIPEFFMRNGLKYFGYKLGRNYTIFPKNIIQKLSMHTLWWSK